MLFCRHHASITLLCMWSGWSAPASLATLSPFLFPPPADEEAIYNPLKLPMGWDGKPIPYWLYKLHGLNQAREENVLCIEVAPLKARSPFLKQCVSVSGVQV